MAVITKKYDPAGRSITSQQISACTGFVPVICIVAPGKRWSTLLHKLTFCEASASANAIVTQPLPLAQVLKDRSPLISALPLEAVIVPDPIAGEVLEQAST